jgi:hypothetical protein
VAFFGSSANECPGAVRPDIAMSKTAISRDLRFIGVGMGISFPLAVGIGYSTRTVAIMPAA